MKNNAKNYDFIDFNIFSSLLSFSLIFSKNNFYEFSVSILYVFFASCDISFYETLLPHVSAVLPLAQDSLGFAPYQDSPPPVSCTFSALYPFLPS